MKLIDIINEGVEDPGIFKAIFLAGGPGSGKSFVGSELVGIPKGGYSQIDMSFAPSGVKLVNSDPAFEYFLKKINVDPKDLDNLSDEEFKKLTVGSDSPREKAKKVKDTQEKLYRKGRLGLLIDGTGDDYGFSVLRHGPDVRPLGVIFLVACIIYIALIRSLFPFPRQEEAHRRCGHIGKRFRRPEGTGKATRKGGVERLPVVVSRRLWWVAPRPAFAKAKLRLRAGRRNALLAGNLATPSYGYNYR